mmetsp:Transcript_24594/g.69416  ORF Transcript_24594/g.69416 Transcript_24594/m.69416 type:complete len:244 (+) Transcript_24594:137-868(+)
MDSRGRQDRGGRESQRETVGGKAGREERDGTEVRSRRRPRGRRRRRPRRARAYCMGARAVEADLAWAAARASLSRSKGQWSRMACEEMPRSARGRCLATSSMRQSKRTAISLSWASSSAVQTTSLSLVRARSMLLKRVLTPFSVRPLRWRLISAQRLPSVLCRRRSCSSSSWVQAPRLMEGSRLRLQRSRHCLAVRPGTLAAMSAQFLGCELDMSLRRRSSSSLDHMPLTRPGWSTFFQRWRH